jgi:hypothetical protein
MVRQTSVTQDNVTQGNVTQYNVTLTYHIVNSPATEMHPPQNLMDGAARLVGMRFSPTPFAVAYALLKDRMFYKKIIKDLTRIAFRLLASS